MNQTFEKNENNSLSISVAQVVPIDIIHMIQEKHKDKEKNKNQIIVNSLPESSKFIDTSIHKQDSQIHILQQRDIYSRNSFRSIGCVCRLCDCPERKDNPLIRVCRCIRSKKYVHEYCLKKSIIEKYRNNISQAKCEICQDNYQMDVKIEKLFQPKIAWQQSQDKIPLVCLLVFLIVMFVVFILLCLRLAESSEITDRSYFLNSQSFLIIFIIFSFIIILILFWFIIMIVKGLLFVEKIVLWKLIEYKPIKKSILNKNVLLSEIQQSFRKSKLFQEKSKGNFKEREKTINVIDSYRSNQIMRTFDVDQQTTKRQLGIGINSQNISNFNTDPKSSPRVRFSII